MFNSSETYAVDRLFLKFDYIRYIPHSLNLVNGENNLAFIDIPGEYSAISLKDGYFDIEFKVTPRDGGHA